MFIGCYRRRPAYIEADTKKESIRLPGHTGQ